MSDEMSDAEVRAAARKAMVRNQSRRVKRALLRDAKHSVFPRRRKKAKEEIKDIDIFLNRGKK
jgi:hypothetical protein